MVIEAALLSLAGDRLNSLVAQRLTEPVFMKWSRHRARGFFAKFTESIAGELATGEKNPKVDEYLDKILNDDIRSEVMFDAYRRVSLTASRDIGPRVIGLLTGGLVVEGRQADEAEECLFMAAEIMNDRELREFLQFYDEQRAKADTPESDVRRTHGGIEIDWCKEVLDSTWNNEYEIQIGPLNLVESLGTWAAKLKQVGLLLDTITDKSFNYPEDSERHVDEPGTERTMTWRIHLSADRLVTLITRALEDDEPERGSSTAVL